MLVCAGTCAGTLLAHLDHLIYFNLPLQDFRQLLPKSAPGREIAESKHEMKKREKKQKNTGLVINPVISQMIYG